MTSGDIITDAQPRAYLLHEGNEVATLQLEADPTHVGVYRALTPPLKAGTYEIAVAESPSAPRSDSRLSLHVSDTGNPEWATLTMNRMLLETMAAEQRRPFPARGAGRYRSAQPPPNPRPQAGHHQGDHPVVQLVVVRCRHPAAHRRVAHAEALKLV
jgi:hypothetical protein